MPGIFKHLIECIAHMLPQGKPIGFNDHTAPYGRIIGQTAFNNQVVIPLRIVYASAGDLFAHVFILVSKFCT